MVTTAVSTIAKSDLAKIAVAEGARQLVRDRSRRKKSDQPPMIEVPYVELADRNITIQTLHEVGRLFREQPMLMIVVSAIGIEMAEKIGLLTNETASVLQGAVTIMGLAQAFGGGTIGNLAAILGGLGVGGGMYAAGEGGLDLSKLLPWGGGRDLDLLEKIPFVGDTGIAKTASKYLPLV